VAGGGRKRAGGGGAWTIEDGSVKRLKRSSISVGAGGGFGVKGRGGGGSEARDSGFFEVASAAEDPAE
jgi:hypothetical protein